MTYQEFKQFSKKCTFLSSLNSKLLQAIYPLCHEISLKQGDYLLKEEDPAEEIYIVIQGELDVLKYNDTHQIQHVIARLTTGEVVGELALLDPAPRSASVRAGSEARLLKIPVSEIYRLVEENPDSFIFMELARNISRRLRSTNALALEALKIEVEQHKMHEVMARYVVYLLISVSIFLYSLPLLRYFLTIVPTSTYVTIPIILFFIAFVLLLIRNSHLPLSTYGITKKDWKRAVFHAVLWTIPVGGGVVLAKMFLIRFYAPYAGHEIFEPFLFLPPDKKIWSYWLILTIMYCVFVPLQELVARGTLQGLLEKVLIGKYKTGISIIISNLLYGISHFILSEQIAVLIFVVGLYMGLLYANTRNLIGPIIAHMIIGVWGLSCIGFIFS